MAYAKLEGAPSKLCLGGFFACSALEMRLEKIPILVAKDATRMGHPRLFILRSNLDAYCTTSTICCVRVADPEVAVTVRL